MLKNAYFLAKIGADTAENEQHFTEILPIGRRVADRCRGPPACSRGPAAAAAGSRRGRRRSSRGFPAGPRSYAGSNSTI